MSSFAERPAVILMQMDGKYYDRNERWKKRECLRLSFNSL